MNKFFRLLLVSAFFIGFPSVSWYYLNEGYKYRMEVIAELDQNLGDTPTFELTNQNGEKVDKGEMKNSVVVSNFVDLKQIDKSAQYMKNLYTIQDQFDKKDDILFFTYVKADSLEAVKGYYKSLKIKEEKQWHFLTGSDQQMDAFINAYPFPQANQKNYVGSNTVAISDTSSTVRFFYDMNDPKKVSRLIEHIANLMPQAPPEKARTKRELDKDKTSK